MAPLGDIDDQAAPPRRVRRSVAAVIVAAGSGRRLSVYGPPKQFRPLLGVPILEWALCPFVLHPAIDRVVVVLPSEHVSDPPPWLKRHPVTIVAGGERRSDSVRAGLDAAGHAEWVVVHDGARPLVGRELLDRVLHADADAVIPGIPAIDTLKEVDSDDQVIRTVDRSKLWQVQTPQLFPLETLRHVHEEAGTRGLSTSDDAALFEAQGLPVRVVPGDVRNLKVTTPFDLAVAEVLARGLPVPFAPETGSEVNAAVREI